jgi:hypothetical protein
MLALEALQEAIVATRETATVSGVLPTDPPAFITDEQSCRCMLPGDKPVPSSGVPFRTVIVL